MKISPNLLVLAHGELCLPGECHAACCVGGIWVDLLDVQQILQHAEQIRPFLAPQYAGNEDLWFEEGHHEHADFPSGIALVASTVPRAANPQVDGCIFLRADHLCGLQVASEALNLPFPGLKPLECVLYPLRISEGELAYDEETTADHPEADCQRPRSAPNRPRYVVFKTAVELTIGREGWLALDQQADK